MEILVVTLLTNQALLVPW